MSWIKTILQESADLTIKRVNSTNCVGTSLKDNFTASYQHVVSKLGPPETHPQGSDTPFEWCGMATTNDGESFAFSVYPNPRYYDHVKPEEMDQWHIGCKTPYQAMLVKASITS